MLRTMQKALYSALVNQGAITRCHRLGGLNRSLFFTVLEAGRFNIRASAESVSGEDTLPVSSHGSKSES